MSLPRVGINNPWIIALLLGIGTKITDYLIHPSYFGEQSAAVKTAARSGQVGNVHVVQQQQGLVRRRLLPVGQPSVLYPLMHRMFLGRQIQLMC